MLILRRESGKYVLCSDCKQTLPYQTAPLPVVFRIAIISAASSGKSVVYPQQGIENIMNKVTKPIENISFFAII